MKFSLSLPVFYSHRRYSIELAVCGKQNKGQRCSQLWLTWGIPFLQEVVNAGSLQWGSKVQMHNRKTTWELLNIEKLFLEVPVLHVTGAWGAYRVNITTCFPYSCIFFLSFICFRQVKKTCFGHDPVWIFSNVKREILPKDLKKL